LPAGVSIRQRRHRIELDDHAEPGCELLEELARVSTAHAVASAALRGLIETMLKRREAA
jgi:hypothetical protein